ncbi:hypothetical protein [Ruania rhizosphaerae]|nr:hypothetical protein [Ruania rhizosphaerae]
MTVDAIEGLVPGVMGGVSGGADGRRGSALTWADVRMSVVGEKLKA